MKGLTLQVAALAMTVVGFGPSCAPRQEASEEGADLAPYVVPAFPEALQHRTLLDFGSKLQLVGYEVTPEGKAGPGESVSLKLYWKSVGTLRNGWGLFTHIESETGQQLWNYDNEGAFRSALAGKAGLSLLEVGKIYLDEQSLTLPKADQLSPRVALVVGVWNRQLRLPMVSGPSNGKEAGIVTYFETGVEPPAPKAP